MTIQLSPEHQSFVATKIREGIYADTDSLIRDAIMVLERKLDDERKLAELRREIDIGIADAEAGRVSKMTPEWLEGMLAEGRRRLGQNR